MRWTVSSPVAARSPTRTRATPRGSRARAAISMMDRGSAHSARMVRCSSRPAVPSASLTAETRTSSGRSTSERVRPWLRTKGRTKEGCCPIGSSSLVAAVCLGTAGIGCDAGTATAAEVPVVGASTAGVAAPRSAAPGAG
ncbi:hypothetical protein RHRU231_390020 [Rhodococcus ruber]|uniref:Uncharacterized protein n=1 Tax=Rhodococcus ruber TaxID=1830 RepID=A0A098BH95_9NOCA|nr:hypothetical protein RHRU231_390020 [Rhodococcus ruber]